MILRDGVKWTFRFKRAAFFRQTFIVGDISPRNYTASIQNRIGMVYLPVDNVTIISFEYGSIVVNNESHKVKLKGDFGPVFEWKKGLYSLKLNDSEYLYKIEFMNKSFQMINKTLVSKLLI